jgi:hypothetical protein
VSPRVRQCSTHRSQRARTALFSDCRPDTIFSRHRSAGGGHTTSDADPGFFLSRIMIFIHPGSRIQQNRIFKQTRPVWRDELETRPKNLMAGNLYSNFYRRKFLAMSATAHKFFCVFNYVEKKVVWDAFMYT